MKALAFSLALGLAFAMPTAFAEEASTIGYVDMQRVLEESALGRRAKERLEEKYGPQRASFAQEEQAIRQMQQTLQRDRPLMSEEQIKKQEAEIQERIQGFQEKASATQEELLAEQQTISQEILGPALEAVDQIAKQQKVSAVFERSRAGLLYADDGIDLTDEVLTKLDANSD